MLNPKSTCLLLLAAFAATEAFHTSSKEVSRSYDVSFEFPAQSRRKIRHCSILAAKKMPKNKNNGAANENDDSEEKLSFMENLKKRPGNLIAAPFVVLVGVDLVLNIGVLVKRTVEFAVFGKLPSTEVWFSDNFFL